MNIRRVRVLGPLLALAIGMTGTPNTAVAQATSSAGNLVTQDAPTAPTAATAQREAIDRQEQRAAAALRTWLSAGAPKRFALMTTNAGAGPSLAGVSPAGLAPGTEEKISLSGEGIDPLAEVTVSGGGVSVRNLEVNDFSSSAEIAVSSDAVIGSRDVVIANPDGTSATCSGCLSVTNTPALQFAYSSNGSSTLVPGSEATTRLEVVGQVLPEITGASAGSGVTVEAVQRRSSSTLQVDVRVSPEAADGWRDLVAEVAGGDTIRCTQCIEVRSTPRALSAAPDTVRKGTSALLEVGVSGVLPGATLEIPGDDQLLTGPSFLLRPDVLARRLTVPDTAFDGPRNVVVTNPSGLTSTCTACLQITSVPQVDNASTLAIGRSGQQLRVGGSGFYPASRVAVGDGVTVSAVQYVSPNELIATVDVPASAPAGAADVTVSTVASGGTPMTRTTCTGCASLSSADELSSTNEMSSAETVAPVERIAPRRVAPGTTSFLSFSGPPGQVSVSGDGITVTDQTSPEYGGYRWIAVTVGARLPVSARDVSVTSSTGVVTTCARCLLITPTPLLEGMAPVLRGSTDAQVMLTANAADPEATVTVAGTGVTIKQKILDPYGGLTLDLDVAPDAAAGIRRLRLTNPDGESTFCDCLDITTQPSIDQSFGLGNGPLASPGTYQIGFIGSGLRQEATVAVSGTGVTAAVVSGSSNILTVDLTVAPGAIPGQRTYTITNPDGSKASCYPGSYRCVWLDVDDDADQRADQGRDNCLGKPNPYQTDSDGDGQGDQCDPVADLQESSVFRPYVQELVDRGITGGCSAAGEPVRYCPDGQVLRGDMSIFLARSALGREGADALPSYADGTFSDVKGEDYFAKYVSWAKDQGITAGCGGGGFCPRSTVNRGDMSIFLARSRLGAEQAAALPAYVDGTFTDVSSADYYSRYVRWVKEKGITAGCGSSTYCPAAPVTRAQMAVFLSRAFAWRS